MADTRNPREVVDIGKFKPYTHPQYGAGAIREVVYIDGTVERRFFHHGTQKDGEGAPDEGYLVDSRVDADLRDKWIKNAPPEARADSRSSEQRQKDEAEAKNAAELQRQREKNAALPPDQDPRYETDKERADRAAATVKEQEAAAEKERQRARQEQQDAEAKAERERQAQRQAAADARAEADRNKPSAPTLKPDGKGGTVAIQTMPDGTIKTTPLPGVPSDRPNPERVTVDGVVYERGQDGVYKPAQGLPAAGQIPKGVPSFTPDLTKPGAGLIDRANQLDELLAAGRITWEQRQRILEADAGLAKQVAGEFNTATTLLREQYQSEVSQRNSDVTQANNRANLANTHHQNAVGVIEKFAPYLGVTPGDAGKLFVGMMASQLATATAYGGMADVPRVQMDPRLSAFVDRTLAGPAASSATVPPGPGEAPAPAADPQAAARAEAEAVRQAHRASGQPLPAPIFAPAPVTAPVQQAGNIPPGMMSPNPPDMTQTTAPVNPLPGQPGHDPTKPVGMAPTPGFIEQVDWGTTPSAQALATGETLFGRTLPPPPSSWRQDAEQQMFAMTQPNPQAYGTGAGLFGASLPPSMTPAPGGMDFSLPPMAGGGMDPIEQEARRQLAAAGVLV